MSREREAVTQYLNGLRWDGQTRIAEILATEDRAPESVALLQSWFAWTVYRVYAHEQRQEWCMLICGAEGLGKTSFLRKLAAPFYGFYGARPWSKWIREVHDLTDERNRGQLNIGRWKRRVGLGLVVEDCWNTLVATDHQLPVFADLRMSRRVRVLPVRHLMNTAFVQEHRDQLWAEAHHAMRYKAVVQ